MSWLPTKVYRSFIPIASVTAAALFFSSISFAHHSDTGLNLDSTVVLEGTITGYNFRNPHVYFTVEAAQSSAQLGEWEIQMGSTTGLVRAGWDRNTLLPGDSVLVRTHPALDGRNYGLLINLEKDGNVLNTRPAATLETASATSLEGYWRGDRTTIGDFTEFFGRLIPTEKGAVARDNFDYLSAENPMSSCTTRPSPASVVSSGIYLTKVDFIEDTIVIENEIFDTLRTVFMDGRAHPENAARTDQGHSIGWWEEDVLVVDTTQFVDHRSPYQNGIPSGAQKHVVERFQLTEDGHRVVLDLMFEDPEYLVQPLEHRLEWVYAPNASWVAWDCDINSSGNFVPE